MDNSGRSRKLFLVALGVCFCGLGLAVLTPALRSLGKGGVPGDAVIPALVFTLVAAALVTAVLLSSKKAKTVQSLRAEHPEQPWLWREDWSHGRATSKTKSSMISAWVIASLWMLVSCPILFVIPKEQFQRQPKTLFALVFPIVGVFLLVWAVRETMRWLEFGKTYFEMPIVPLVAGREMRGTIQARFSNLPEQGVKLKLSCIHRTVRGSGKNQSVEEKILWRDEKVVGREQLSIGPVGTSIPVTFGLPAEALSTNSSNSRDAILWQLEADADVPGVDYKDLFEVPVFHTKDSPAFSDASVWSKEGPMAPAHPTIVVRPSTGGGTEFYFPAARNIGFAMGTSVFALAWGGLIGFMVAYHAPFFFPLVFGLFEVLIAFIALEQWLGTSSVVIEGETLRVRAGLFTSGRTQQILRTQIATLQAAITAQQGGATGTPYYDIQLVTTDHKTITLGKTLRDKHEADWLISEMERLTSSRPRAMAASAR